MLAVIVKKQEIGGDLMQLNKSEEMDIKYLAETFLKQMTKFYEDPENDKKFKEWEKQREIRLSESNPIFEGGSNHIVCNGSRSSILSPV